MVKAVRYWEAQGTNIGLDSRYLRLNRVPRASYDYFLEYDQLPNNKSDSARTLFNGVGGPTLTLGAGLTPFEIATERQRIERWWQPVFPQKLEIQRRLQARDKGRDRQGRWCHPV